MEPASLLLVIDGESDGPTNMSRDRAALARFEDASDVHDACALLRIYRWSPAAISLGYHQDPEDLDIEALARAGIDWVRRPTGGAAVLHHDEITYAVSGPLGLAGLGRSVMSIHAAIAGALCTALRALDVDARTEGDGRPTRFACFAAAGGHEITVGGRKLVGSALRRTRRAFLQHGSVLTGPGHLRLPEFVAAERKDAAREAEHLATHTCHLRELGADHVDAELFGREFARSLSARLGTSTRQVDRDAFTRWLDPRSES